MRKPADLAVSFRSLDEIQVRERVRLGRAAGNVECLEQRFADQMRRLARSGAQAQVHIGLAEIGRLQLRVGVGEVQQMHVAEALHIVEAVGCGLRDCVALHQRKASRRGSGEQLQEFAAMHE